MPTTTTTLYDRDTAPGAEPEELQKLRIPPLVIPGDAPFHATSAAQYLAMQLPQSEYWDAPVAQQEGERVRKKIREFLLKHTA